jgi:hypothetical protein
VYIVYIAHRLRSKQSWGTLPTALTPNSHGSNGRSPPNNGFEREMIYWRSCAMNGTMRQQHPQSYQPQPHSLPPQYPQYQHRQQTHFAPSGGDAQHHGHTEPVGSVGQNAAYVQGKPQLDYSAPHERGTMSAQLEQMPSVVFPPGPSGYNPATNSTTWDQNR